MSRIYEALQKAESERTVERREAEPRTSAVHSSEALAQAVVAETKYGITPEPAAIEAYREPSLAGVGGDALDLSQIVRRPWAPALELLPSLQERGPGVEQFRSLRSRIFELRDIKPLKSIMVSSGMPQEGKSFISTNLAVSLARHKNSRVLLIDGDMRRYTLHQLLGCESHPGLADYLAGKASLVEVMQRAEQSVEVDGTGKPLLPNLTFIAGGNGGDKAADLSGSPRFSELIKLASPHFDWIIVDSSPVLPVSDAVNLSRSCDGVFAGRPRRGDEVFHCATGAERVEGGEYSRLRTQCCTGHAPGWRLLRIRRHHEVKGAIEPMIRLFNVYYPTRTIVLLLCEALIVSGSFLLATALMLGPDTYLVLNYEYGAVKIVCLTVLTLLCSYYFDLYEPQRISARWEIYFRLLLVLGFLSFLLSAILYFFPDADIAHYVLLLGLSFLTVALVAWRSAYQWIIGRKIFRERVYVLGAGARALTIVELLRTRKDAGMEVVGWDGILVDKVERKESFVSALESFRGPDPRVDRVIVAMEDRRGELPLRELLKLRFDGVVIEEAGALLERLTESCILMVSGPAALFIARGFA